MSFKGLFSFLDRFFFAPASPVPLAIFRILVGCLVLQTVAVQSYPDWSLYYSEDSFIPTRRTMAFWWQYTPAINIIALLPPGNEPRLAFFAVMAMTALLVTVGLFTRYTLPILFLMSLTLAREFPLNQNGGDVMLHLSIFLLCFGRSQDALSADNLLRAFREDWRKTGFEPVHSPPWVQRCLQLQLSLAYLDTFLWKITGPTWLNGLAVYYATRLPDFVKFELPFFLDNALVMRLATWWTLVVEFALAVLIWFRDLRYAVIVAGLLLHLGIDYTMNLPVFEAMFVSMYVLFVYPRDLTRFWNSVKAAIARRFGPARRLSFDGDCLLCVRAIGVLHRLDILARFKLVDFRDQKNREVLADLDYERAGTEMLLETKSGWIGGFEAFRAMSLWLPMLWPVAPFLRLPGMSAVGNYVYKWIAARRYLLFGRCEDGACSLHATQAVPEAAAAASSSETARRDAP